MRRLPFNTILLLLISFFIATAILPWLLSNNSEALVAVIATIVILFILYVLFFAYTMIRIFTAAHLVNEAKYDSAVDSLQRIPRRLLGYRAQKSLYLAEVSGLFYKGDLTEAKSQTIRLKNLRGESRRANSDQSHRVLAHYFLALIALEQHDLDTADGHLQFLKDNGSNFYDMVIIDRHLVGEEWQSALVAINDLVRRAEIRDNAEITEPTFAKQAWVHAQLGQREKALKKIVDIEHFTPDAISKLNYAIVNLYLGKTLLQLDMRDEGQHKLNTAIETDPAGSTGRKAQDLIAP